MVRKADSVISSPPLRFGLKSLLAVISLVAVLIAPVHWFGGAYLVSAGFSAALVIACAMAYRRPHPAASMAVAAGGTFVGFFLVIGLLVFFFHSVLNLAVCGLLLMLRVRPRVFATGLAAVAAAIYGVAFWNGAVAMRELAGLKIRYPIVSLEERLSFERVLKPAIFAPDNPAPISGEVAANLDEFDSHFRDGYYRRTWALRELHEETYRHFTRAAGFGFMRMPTVSEFVLKLEPRPEVNTPLPIDLSTLDSPRSELLGKHRLAVLDFVEPDRLGYAQSRNAVAGFDAHGFSSLPKQMSDDKQIPRLQIARLELVSLLRHDEPRVYIASTLPQMDQLSDVPHRPLNTFEDGALPKLKSHEDLVMDSQPARIQMLGAIRAGAKCLACHEGERGSLLGAFSYEITPVATETQAIADARTRVR